MNTAIRLKIMEHVFRGGLWHQSGNTPTQKLNFQTGSNTWINIFILATLPTFFDAPKEMKETPEDLSVYPPAEFHGIICWTSVKTSWIISCNKRDGELIIE